MMRSRRAKRKTDYGTIILHWLLVIFLTIAVITGLGIAVVSPELDWIRWVDSFLPRDFVWTGHIPVAVGLFAETVAYVIYVSRAGLVRRIRPDKARLLGLFGSAKARWGALNILLCWILFLTLIMELVTGALIYLGYGEPYVSLHRFGTWIIIAYVPAHVAVHWAIGGKPQLLRVFRPTNIAPPPPPFDPFDIILTLSEPSAREASTAQPAGESGEKASGEVKTKPVKVRRGTVLQANPFAVAVAVAFAATALLLTVNQEAQESLTVRYITSKEAPVLDGDLSDPVWRTVKPLTVLTNQGANFGGAGETTVEIRAVHDGKQAYFAFVWDDPTRSLKHLPLVKTAKGWLLLHREYDLGAEDSYFEDKFSVLFTTLTVLLAGDRTFHSGRAPAPGKPATFSGRGLHFSPPGVYADVWQWRAVNGGLLGWVDDNHFAAPYSPTQEQREGRAPYKGGFAPDPGAAIYSNNFEQRGPGGYDRPVTPRRLPKNWRAARSNMGHIDLDPNRGESEDAKWWLTEEDSVPYSAELDAQIPEGVIIPGVIISGSYSGNRADVKCGARWGAWRWVLEVARLLDTNNEHDIPIASGTYMRVAAFDHSQISHTRHIRPIRLEVEPCAKPAECWSTTKNSPPIRATSSSTPRS